MSSALIIPKDIQNNIIGENTLNINDIYLQESDKTSQFNELLKKNSLFRNMVLFLFSNSNVKSQSITQSQQSTYLLLQLDKEDMDTYTRKREQDDNMMTVRNPLKFIQNANKNFTDEEFKEFKETFFDIIENVELEEFFDNILDIEDIDEKNFNTIFSNKEFKEFKEKLKTIRNGKITIEDLTNIKIRNILVGEKGQVGTQDSKPHPEEEEIVSQNYLNSEEYKNRLEDKSDAEDHLSLIAKFQDSLPILYDDIMKYISIKPHYIKRKKAIVEDKTSLRVVFDQYSYLRQIFLKFGFEDLEESNFELHSSILKSNNLITNIEGSLSKQNNLLVYVAPVYEKKELTKIRLVGTKSIQEFDIDKENELAKLETEINEYENIVNKDYIYNEIKDVLLKSDLSEIAFINSLLSTITPSEGKINVGEFTMVISHNKPKMKDMDDFVNQVRELQETSTERIQDDAKKLKERYQKFKALFDGIQGKHFDIEKIGKIHSDDLPVGKLIDGAMVHKPLTSTEKKYSIILKPEDFKKKAQDDAKIKMLNKEIQYLDSQILTTSDKKKKRSLQAKLRSVIKNKKDKNYKNYKNEEIVINTHFIIEEIFSKTASGYGAGDKVLSRHDATQMYIKALKDIMNKLEKDNTELIMFEQNLGVLHKFLKKNKDGELGKTTAFAEQTKSMKEMDIKGFNPTDLTDNYDVLDAYAYLKKKNTDEDLFFETIADGIRTTKTTKTNRKFYIPIVEEKKYVFNKKGSVNTKKFKIKWSKQGNKKTATQNKKQSKGEFGDTISDSVVVGEKPNVNLKALFDALLRNFKTLRGLTK